MKYFKVLSFAILVLIAFSFTNPALKGGYKIGDVAADFKLKSTTGKYISLRDYPDAKGYIIVFTCNHCPYAKAYENRIMALDKKYSKLGYPVIAINPNNPKKQPEDSFDRMKVRAAEMNYSFPYLIDEGQRVFPLYGATKTPQIYVLQKTSKGNEVRYIGAIDDNFEDAKSVKVKYVENAVDALLSNKEIKLRETKAIGCSIKI